MAIYAYTGLMGSGKSYGVVENVILPHVKAGRVVWTNIPLVDDAWVSLLGSDAVLPVNFDIKDLVDNPRWFFDVLPAGAICVLDEVPDIWPSGIRQKDLPSSHSDYLRKHRHVVDDLGRSSDLVLVCQDLAQIARPVRVLVEFTFRVSKLSGVGLDKKFRVDVYKGPMEGPNPPSSKSTRQIYGTYKPSVYALYVSHTMQHGSGAAPTESRIDKRSSIWSSWLFRAALVVVPVVTISAIFYSVHALSHPHFVSSSSLPSAPLHPVVWQSTHPVVPVRSSSIPVPSGPSWSLLWRLVGSAAHNGHLFYVVSAPNGRIRYVPPRLCPIYQDNRVCRVDGFLAAAWTGTGSASASPLDLPTSLVTPPARSGREGRIGQIGPGVVHG